MDPIELGDGRLVELGEPALGGSKNETRFGRIGRQRVVVKIQGAHGRVDDEAQALRFLAKHGVRVPRIRGCGVTPGGRHFLVLSREDGAPPIGPEGWGRLGRDLAALLDVPIGVCPFPRVTLAQFIADHQERLDLVRPLLKRGLADEISAAISQVAGDDRLAVTHGDPGSGNYLDGPAGRGVLLDWETPSVSPVGLDLGRAAFIGLLDLWHTGIPNELVAAFIRGYTGRSPRAAQVNPELVSAWITIAGLQFIHGRHTQPLLPERTPQAAADVLATYLRRAVWRRPLGLSDSSR